MNITNITLINSSVYQDSVMLVCDISSECTQYAMKVLSNDYYGKNNLFMFAVILYFLFCNIYIYTRYRWKFNKKQLKIILFVYDFINTFSIIGMFYWVMLHIFYL